MKSKGETKRKALVWFYRDLRLKDNLCLEEASGEGLEIIPVFVWDPSDHGPWKLGEASRWWLYKSLKCLIQGIEKQGGELILKMGLAEDIIPQLAEALDVNTVYFSRVYDPAGRKTQDILASNLREKGVTFRSFNNALLNEPSEILNGTGKPFQVFTPYWKKAKAIINFRRKPISRDHLNFARPGHNKLSLDQVRILPSHHWHGKLDAHWDTSESGAQKLLERIPREIVTGYAHRRNKPGVAGTSCLSPYLAWGVVSPRQVLHAVSRMENKRENGAASKFLAEIGWREFSHHLLYHFPMTRDHPLREKYRRFPWRNDDEALSNWQHGKTGYPLVDAGMRQLWETGWMHNRVRMVVASFLVKHLLLPWQAGARWFWDTLVDADLASNTQGWQWSAGCGADAAPYYRIFNPLLQGEKFDSAGDYVRKWIPEIGALPRKWIHQPWNAPNSELRQAKISLGRTYPLPIVEHTTARNRALAALATLKKE